ncbi:MAG: hypothetical protein QXE92_03430 [Thermofilaceae archaeon]
MVFEELKPVEEITFEKILGELIKKDENLALKSHVPNPLALDVLKVVQLLLEKRNLKRSSQIIEWFIEYFLVYMISKDRLSRQEIVKAVSEMAKVKLEEKTLKEKLLGVE